MTRPTHLSSHRAGHCAGFDHAAVGSEHGTHVAGVVTAAPERPIPGFGANATARIFSISRHGDDGQLPPWSQADVTLAIDRAVAEDARQKQVSSGQLIPTRRVEPILAETVARFAEPGAPIVAVKRASSRGRRVPLGPVCAWPIDPSGGSRKSRPTQQ